MQHPDARLAWITGGGTGIGRALALKLATRGWRVVVSGRRPKPLAETAAMSTPGAIRTWPLDVTDVEAVRRQLQSPAWGRLVGVRSKHGDNVDVYFKDGGSGHLGGIVVIAAEPKELTIVNIMGTLDPDKLADLGGQFGIPRLERSRVHREAQ